MSMYHVTICSVLLYLIVDIHEINIIYNLHTKKFKMCWVKLQRVTKNILLLLDVDLVLCIIINKKTGGFFSYNLNILISLFFFSHTELIFSKYTSMLTKMTKVPQGKIYY